jgi:CubicO group peptidase (beta-lactamase class C family)
MSTLTDEIDWGEKILPGEIGMDDQGVKKIIEVYESQLAEGLHLGSQLVVLWKSNVLVDRADGIANVRRKLKVTPNTPFHCFSITKPFTAICIHKLIEEGRVDLDAPIAEYWPEFGTKGKETATIRHALLHQAGIPVRGLYTQTLLWMKWNLVTRNVANLEAEFHPGTKTGYHVVNFGFILGEVVRRVTGKPIRIFLGKNFLQPLNLKNSYLGLPVKLQKEAAHLYCGDDEQKSTVLMFNMPFIRSAVIPAANLNSTARDLAVFFQMLLNQGTYAGKMYLKPETIAKAVSLGFEGYDEVLEENLRWGYGFGLGGVVKSTDPPISSMGSKSSLTTFGHIGQNCCMVWADSKEELVVSFTTNRLLSGEKSREMFNAISNAVWEAVS